MTTVVCRENEIIMPAEHSGVVMETYKWKVVMVTSTTIARVYNVDVTAKTE